MRTHNHLMCIGAYGDRRPRRRHWAHGLDPHLLSATRRGARARAASSARAPGSRALGTTRGTADRRGASQHPGAQLPARPRMAAGMELANVGATRADTLRAGSEKGGARFVPAQRPGMRCSEWRRSQRRPAMKSASPAASSTAPPHTAGCMPVGTPVATSSAPAFHAMSWPRTRSRGGGPVARKARRRTAPRQAPAAIRRPRRRGAAQASAPARPGRPRTTSAPAAASRNVIAQAKNTASMSVRRGAERPGNARRAQRRGGGASECSGLPALVRG